jgi:hypothetical protein
VAAISDPTKLTFTDCPTTGATWSYKVFAVTAGEDGYVAVAASNVVTIVVPKPTPKPVPTCGLSLTAVVIAPTVMGDGVAMVVVDGSGYKVRLTWTKYTCDLFQWYVVGKSSTHSTPDFPLPHEGTDGIEVSNNVNTLTWTDSNVVAGQTYYYRVMAWNEQAFCNGGTVLGKSNIVTVTIPAAPAP